MGKVLSPFPYYGGKAKMSPLICSMLDYDRTEIYVEPYGGGCRTLLNKYRHEKELYNDFGFGLTSFMNVMSDVDKTELLIEMLRENTPTRERFDELVIRRMEIEDRLNTSTNERLGLIALEDFRRTGISLFKILRKKAGAEDYEGIIGILREMLHLSGILNNLSGLRTRQYSYFLKLYEEYWDIVKDEYDRVKKETEIAFDKKWGEILGEIPESGNFKKKYDTWKADLIRNNTLQVLHRYTNDILISNEEGSYTSDIEIAFIIFQLYYSSRDGMGVVWSEEKNRSERLYHKAVNNLRNVSERMQGVIITQADALDLVRIYRTDEKAMIYLDPSYLKPEDETKNLGEIYKMSYEYQDHEKLLAELVKPDTYAKVLISNYDVELYNSYLANWDKTYYKTFTGVGSKKGNRRVEVLWRNY